MDMDKDELRKGPWTEQEDAQLVLYVNLFGDRRWDFIAKVSGLRRSGKSCRLRWVNYLHPGLRRGKMTPHEERLVLQLHNKWGNRWSKIAQKLPGRTDNEIKNYWKTHMRKKTQEWKRCTSPSTSSCSSSSSSTKEIKPLPTPPFTTLVEPKEHNFYVTGGVDMEASPGADKTSLDVGDSGGDYSMDEIWKDMELSEDGMALPQGDIFPIDSSQWSMNDEESNMGAHIYSFPYELQDDDLMMKFMH